MKKRRVPAEVKTNYELGPNGGVMLTLAVPGSKEFIREEFFPPNEDRDYFEAVAPLLSFRTVAAIMGITKKTLYSRCAYFASSIKICGRWFFKKTVFYETDLAEESELPTRAEILAERKERATRGEVLRPGRHAEGCPRDHSSNACGDTHRQRRIRGDILRTLGR